jgi:hypothetical protein
MQEGQTPTFSDERVEGREMTIERMQQQDVPSARFCGTWEAGKQQHHPTNKMDVS